MAVREMVLIGTEQTTLSRRRTAALRDGLAHGSQIFPRDPLPHEPVTVVVVANATLPIDLVAVYYTTDGSEPKGERGKTSHGQAIEAEAGIRATDPETRLPIREWRAQIPAQAAGTLVRYRVEGWSVRGARRVWWADRADAASAGPIFAYSVDNDQVPSWFDDAIIYQIIVDRFSSAPDEPPMHDPHSITGIYGGTLAGVRSRLDDLRRLGVNCLWLSPVLESPSHHGYDPASHYYVARRYGGNEALRALIAAAHAREMRVILDFVANHTSTEHPLFQRAQADPQSTLRDWYTFGDYPPAGYRTYEGVEAMPELNTEAPDVRRYLATAARFWISEMGADGFRLDHVSGPSHTFWTYFQREIKSRFPQALTLGEISASPDEIATYGGRVDAAMDFTLAAHLRRVFAERTEPLAALLSVLTQQRAEKGAALAYATLLDNHDMPRFLALAGGDTARLRLAATCQMTLPGTPIIYYGTEVGLTQTGDAETEHAYARAPMRWDQSQDGALWAHFQALCALRAGHPALRDGHWAPLLVEVRAGLREAEAQAGAYLRYSDAEYLVVALNNTLAPVRLRINLARELGAVGTAAAVGEQLGHRLGAEAGRALPVSDGFVEVPLPPLGAAVLGPQ